MHACIHYESYIGEAAMELHSSASNIIFRRARQLGEGRLVMPRFAALAAHAFTVHNNVAYGTSSDAREGVI